MTLSTLKQHINRHPQLKSRMHRLMFRNARPRWWVKHLLNPLVFRHGKGVVIRRQTVLNVSPINRFRVGHHSTIEEYTVVDNGVGDVIIGNYTRIGIRTTLIGPANIGSHVIHRGRLLDRLQQLYSGRSHHWKTCHSGRRKYRHQGRASLHHCGRKPRTDY